MATGDTDFDYYEAHREEKMSLLATIIFVTILLVASSVGALISIPANIMRRRRERKQSTFKDER